MALFKYGFKRKYVGFHENFFTKVCLYNLPRNFSASKLSWYTVGKLSDRAIRVQMLASTHRSCLYTCVRAYVHAHTHTHTHTQNYNVNIWPIVYNTGMFIIHRRRRW